MSSGKIFRPALTPNMPGGAAGTATGNITPGRTIESIIFKLGGTFDITMITLLRIKANGKTIMEGTGQDFADVQAFRGATANTGYLEVPFVENRKGRAQLDEMVGAFDTSIGVANVTYELTYAGATSATLPLVYTIESAPQVQPSGSPSPYANMLSKMLRYPYQVAAGGQISIPLPFGPVNGSIIKRIHLVQATASNVLGCVIRQDGVVLHDSLKADNDYLNVEYKNVNVTKKYTIDFMIDGNIKNAFDTRDARSVELIPNFNAADTGFVLVEYLDQLANL